MTVKFSEKYKKYQNIIKIYINDFNSKGDLVYGGDRNAIKVFDVDHFKINIKAFKVPNLVNQIVYRFLRKSKAQRSFEFANKLIDLDIGTPKPIAFYEFKTPFLFKKSFYVSEQLDYDLTFRELTTDLDYPDHDAILRAFTRFSFKLHEKGINFLDHSPGNTLIKKVGVDYQFFLVDLNRMKFMPMDFNQRIKNLRRLSKQEPIISVMADEYAKCIGKDKSEVLNTFWHYVNSFQRKYTRRARLKRAIKFWKN